MNWEWLGGFFDGDGSAFISILKFVKYGKWQLTFRPRIIFSQTDRQILQQIGDFVNLEFYIGHGRKKTFFSIHKPTGRRLTAWNLEFKGYKTISLLSEKLIPVTILKRRQLELLNEFCHLRKHERYPWRKEEFLQALSIIREMKQLNLKPRTANKTFELINRLEDEAKHLPDHSLVYPIFHRILGR